MSGAVITVLDGRPPARSPRPEAAWTSAWQALHAAGQLSLDDAFHIMARSTLRVWRPSSGTEGYLRRQELAVDRQRRQEGRAIPEDFVFAGIPGLSREMVERLSHIRPATLGHAARIPGVTPAAVALIASRIQNARTSTPV